ncbi:MAG: class IV adenylate cyclase [Planctomycetota bacterium]
MSNAPRREYLEVECKIPIPDREALARRLCDLGAEDGGDALERNRLFDTPDGTLRASGRLLRLRDYQGAVLTYKGGVLPSGDFKRREEINCPVASFEDAREILKRLGYGETWYYEKRRHLWRYRNSAVALDLLPGLGAFIEVEGDSAEAIDAVLEDLCLDRGRHVPKTYLELFAEHCAAEGRPLEPMRFS